MKVLKQTKVLDLLRDWDFWQAMLEKAACVIACFCGLAGLALLAMIITARSRIRYTHSTAECGRDHDPKMASEK